MEKVVNIGILKFGCIGTLPLLESIIDERATRTDIKVQVFGSGTKLGFDHCRRITEIAMNQNLDFLILVSPAQGSISLKKVRKIIGEKNFPAIIISDFSSKKAAKDIEKEGFGYIIVEADSMIGARREFLDPSEMIIYNSDLIKILAITGTLNLIVDKIDGIIKSIKNGKKPQLPFLIIDELKAVDAAEFLNPYAKAKAIAAYLLAKQVSKITTKACFKISDSETAVFLVSAAHEIMRVASKLVDEARELEKAGDSQFRKLHSKDGAFKTKRKLLEKPKRIE
jgi:methylenetetrahydromethanopterin dehydrogenase